MSEQDLKNWYLDGQALAGYDGKDFEEVLETYLHDMKNVALEHREQVATTIAAGYAQAMRAAISN